MSLPEYAFFEPLAVLLRHGHSMPRHLEAQVAEIVWKLQTIRIPKGHVDCSVIHRIEPGGSYSGFSIARGNLMKGRDRALFVVDRCIDVFLPSDHWVGLHGDFSSRPKEYMLRTRNAVEMAVASVVKLSGEKDVWDRKRCEQFFDDEDNFLAFT